MNKSILSTGKKKSKKIVIFIPGISGNATGEKYAPLAEEFTKNHIDVLRLDIWESSEELNLLSIDEIHNHMKNIVNEMRGKGYESVGIMSLSLGAAITLLFKDRVEFIVTWAPALKFSDISNISSISSIKFSEINDFNEIKISAMDLEELKTPVLLLHGDNDKLVDIENSKRIFKEIKNAKFKIIPGGTHSFGDIYPGMKIMAEVIDYIKTPKLTSFS